MAVFMINICKFNGCGLTFPGLGDLIQHIEDTHIDYDPLVVEQKEQAQPSCIPLSYVLRFITDAARREGLSDVRKKMLTQAASAMKCSNSNSSIGSSLHSSTPTGSDMDEEEARSDSEDSNDSWTTPEEFSAEFILSLAIKSRVPVVNNKKNNTVGWIASNTKDNNNAEKPFACPVPGCKKRYKNVNGIKYHSKNGHKKDGKVRKGFKCHCGKSYKTAQGLKSHTAAYHNGTSLTTITTPTGEMLQIPTSQVTSLQPLQPLQPVRTVTVKQISASSLSSLGLPVKSIQSVVVTTNKNYDDKTTTLRVLKDISLPLVKTTSALQLIKSEPDKDLEAEVPLIDLEQPDKDKIFKLKLQPDGVKERYIKILSAEEAEKIQVGHLQIKLPEPKLKLTTIKSASVKVSSPQLVTSPKYLEGIPKTKTHDTLGGILTPATSPLTSPESKSLVQQHRLSPSPVLPLTPVSPSQPIKPPSLPSPMDTSEPAAATVFSIEHMETQLDT